VNSRQLCPRFHRAVELIGRRWNGAIVFVLLQDSARFCELRAAIPGITDRMLTERLQALEHEGIVSRTVLAETPVRIDYALTKKGRALGEAFKTISSWGEKWLPPEPTAPRTKGEARAGGRGRRLLRT
jgi:DNA-binding HxlR family transcriptional regulator